MNEHAGEPPLILVVDDQEANLDILVDVLADDYLVSVAMDGRSALQSVLETPPDLILLDIMMPVMDGYEVCRRLQEDMRFKQIPIIFLSAMSEVGNKTKGFELGAVDYITKPFEVAEVKARVQTHLKLRRVLAELERQNQQLKDYARLRDEVERMTRHDLKSPLSAVINVPEMLLEEDNLSEDQRTLLRLLQESGHRMLHMINSSLDLYKMEIGRYQINPEPVEVARLVKQVWAECRELAHAKRLDLILFVDGRPARSGDSLWVLGEELLIYSALANLIKNAAEASPANQSITVSLENAATARVIAIHNQGEVPAALRANFFEKFATAGKKGGTGLGTYTARLMAQTMGGSIAMVSSAQRGTLISLSLPPASAGPNHQPAERREGEEPEPPLPQAAVAPERSAPPAGPPTRRAVPDLEMGILVVDDYSNMRRLTKSVLRRMGYNNLFEASNGQDAWQLLAGKPIGLVISDVNMPIMGGVELLTLVRQDPRMADLPFILVTGEAEQMTVLAAAKAHVTDYILKPFSPESLKVKLEKALRRGR